MRGDRFCEVYDHSATMTLNVLSMQTAVQMQLAPAHRCVGVICVLSQMLTAYMKLRFEQQLGGYLLVDATRYQESQTNLFK